MIETDSTDYAVRTEKNVLAADATVIFFDGEISGGTLLSKKIADKISQESLLINLDETNSSVVVEKVFNLIIENNFAVINFSGPRESESKQIYLNVLRILNELIAQIVERMGRL